MLSKYTAINWEMSYRWSRYVPELNVLESYEITALAGLLHPVAMRCQFRLYSGFIIMRHVVNGSWIR